MKITPGTARILSSLIALASAVPALAHDTWLQGPRLPIASGSTVLFELTSGGAFPSLDRAVEAGRIAREGIRLGGMTRRFKLRSRGKEALRLQAPLAVEGVAVAFVSLRPQALELKPAQVEEYLAEIGERERVGAEWQRGPRRWREVYRKHAKTFLRVGQAAGGPGASGFTLAATDGRERRFQRTDTEGRATLRLDRPGRWLLAGTYLRRASRPDAEWESDFTTLTLQVGAMDGP